MAGKRRSADKAVAVVLGEDLRIGTAKAAFESLEAAAASPAVEIDASNVVRVDGAGLQAVAAALARLRRHGVTWRWHEPTVALTAAARLAGLDGALEFPRTEAASR